MNTTHKPLFITRSNGREYELADMKITALMPQGIEYEYEVFEEVTKSGAGTPLHTHIEQWEILEVIEGTYKMMANNETFIAKPGNMVIVPPNTPHCFLNIDPTPSKLRFILSPGKNFEGFLIEMSQLTQKPTPNDMTVLLNKFGMELLGGPMSL